MCEKRSVIHEPTYDFQKFFDSDRVNFFLNRIYIKSQFVAVVYPNVYIKNTLYNFLYIWIQGYLSFD